LHLHSFPTRRSSDLVSQLSHFFLHHKSRVCQNRNFTAVTSFNSLFEGSLCPSSDIFMIFSPNHKSGVCQHRNFTTVAYPLMKEGDRKSTRLNSSHDQ